MQTVEEQIPEPMELYHEKKSNFKILHKII